MFETVLDSQRVSGMFSSSCHCNRTPPDSVEGPLLKVMFGRRQPSGLSQLQHIETLLTALGHLLKPDTHTGYITSEDRLLITYTV